MHQKYVIFLIGLKVHSIRKKSALKFLLPMMFDWFDVKIDEGYVVWQWVQKKYEKIKIGGKYIQSEKNCSYLAVIDNGQLNWCKNKW